MTLIESSTVRTSFDIVNSLNLTIKELHEFEYTASINGDSVKKIIDILNSKTYLHRGERTFGTQYRQNTLTISLDFFNLNNERVNDWDSTASSLNLIENFQSKLSKWGVVSVPMGKEQFWADLLKKHPQVKIAEVNHIGYIH